MIEALIVFLSMLAAYVAGHMAGIVWGKRLFDHMEYFC